LLLLHIGPHLTDGIRTGCCSNGGGSTRDLTVGDHGDAIVLDFPAASFDRSETAATTAAATLGQEGFSLTAAVVQIVIPDGGIGVAA
jgi:hypothetical protein